MPEKDDDPTADKAPPKPDENLGHEIVDTAFDDIIDSMLDADPTPRESGDGLTHTEMALIPSQLPPPRENTTLRVAITLQAALVFSFRENI